MGLFDNGMKIGAGLAIGFGTIVLAPVVIPVLAGVARPLVKEIIKNGFILYERSKVMAAEARETLEDLAAEVQAEVIMGRQEGPPATGESTESK